MEARAQAPGDNPEGRPTRNWGGFLRLLPVHLDAGDVLVQVIAVALGVILGFGVSSWNDRMHARSLLRETVGNIVAEIRANRDGMQHVRSEHEKSAAALAAFAAASSTSASVGLKAARKIVGQRPFRVNIPLGIAWQIAQNDQGLTLLPYQDRYDLAWIYQVQSVYYEAERRYENSLLTITEPPNGNYYFEVADLANQAQAVVSAERLLDTLYAAAIKQATHEFAL